MGQPARGRTRPGAHREGQPTQHLVADPPREDFHTRPPWWVRPARDILILFSGLGLLASQVVAQFKDHEPNLALIAAGVTMLGVVPLVQLGDRKADAVEKAP